MNKILPVTETAVAENYPYSGMRTKMFFSVQFHSKRGFRGVTQSLNPKTGVMNKPHPGTYADLMWIEKDEKDHYEFNSGRINGFNSIDNMCKFISNNFDKLCITEDMVKFICKKMIMSMKISIAFDSQDKGQLLESLKPTIDKLVIGAFKGENIFGDVYIADKIMAS